MELNFKCEDMKFKRSVLTKEQVEQIVKLYVEGARYREIGKKFNIGNLKIRACLEMAGCRRFKDPTYFWLKNYCS